jgi:hypothetical protein
MLIRWIEDSFMFFSGRNWFLAWIHKARRLQSVRTVKGILSFDNTETTGGFQEGTVYKELERKTCQPTIR